MTFPKCLLAFQPTLLNPDTQTLGRVSSLGMALSPGVVSSSLSSPLKGGQGWSRYLIPFTSALHPMPHDSSFQATACLLKQTQSGGQEKLGSSGTSGKIQPIFCLERSAEKSSWLLCKA